MLSVEEINNLEKENGQLKAKIATIVQLCKECPAIDTELSLRILEVING